MNLKNLPWFPSPCGDVVLKSNELMRKRSILTVSVPLRGCGFEIKDGFMINEFRGKFPSPCGDVVLKSGRRRG